MWDDEEMGFKLWQTTSDDIEKARRLIARVNELLKHSSIVFIDQNDDLKKAVTELEEFRSTCKHSWSVILMFLQHKSYCKICGVEDSTYRHNY